MQGIGLNITTPLLQLLQHQADYITFLYGLAYVMLGCVAFLQRFLGESRIRWHWMAVFGFMHGLHEWFDLATFVFPGSRIGVVSTELLALASFAALLAFAKDQTEGNRAPLESKSLPYLSPELRWPILLFGVGLVLILIGPVSVAEVYSRGFALLAGFWAASVLFIIRSRLLDHVQRRWLVIAGVATLAFGLGEGFFEYLLHEQGGSTQWAVLFRAVQGVLALSVMGAVWGFIHRAQGLQSGGDDNVTDGSGRLAGQYTVWLAVSLLVVVVMGGYVTLQLGRNAQQAVERHSDGDTEILATHLRDQMARTEMLAALIARSNSLRRALENWTEDSRSEAEVTLHKYGSVLEQSTAFLMKPNGLVLASSAPVGEGKAVGESFGFLPFFQDSAAYGLVGKDLSVEPDGAQRGYYVSQPVMGNEGRPVGISVIKKVLTKPIQQFDGNSAWFLVNPAGVVFIASRPELTLRPLWPLQEVTRQQLQRTGEMGRGTFEGGLLTERPEHHSVVQWNGRPVLVNVAPIRSDGWSAILIEDLSNVAQQRFYGILVTIAVALFTLTFFMVLHRESAYEAKLAEDQKRLQSLNEELEKQASTDGLTGLFNRQKFNTLLNGEIDRARRYGSVFALVIFDVDHFKRINDTWGHQVGDSVLCNLTRLANDTARSSDALARWGGEEFMVILPMTARDGALSFAERLRAALAQFNFDPVPKVSCSFGITEYSPGDQLQDIVQRADMALYQAKENGRDRAEVLLAEAGNGGS